MSATEQRFLDDFVVGERFEAPPITLAIAHFEMFADMTGDSHPIHTDTDYAKAQGFDAPLAHGLLLLATTAFGATPASAGVHDAMIAMLGSEARFRAPAFVGDRITRTFEVLDVEPKDEARGILHLGLALTNQEDKLVLEGKHLIMLKRRASQS